MLGAFFAICSAATFGFNSAAMRRGVLQGTVFQAIAITVPIGVPLFLLAALIGGQLGDMFAFGWTGTGYLAAAGILHFVWGRYWNYRAVKEMGANLSGAVQQISLVAALAFAMVLLGEQLTILRIIGIVLVVGGPFIMTSGRGAKRGKKAKAGDGEKDAAAAGGAKPPVFRPNILAGYVAGLMATLGYGMTPTLVRLGLADTGASLAGGAISYIAATLAFAVLLLVPGQLYHCFAIDRTAAKWFTVSGVFVFLAQMFRYLALAIAPVTVVTPIQRLSLVFRILLSTLINRDYEVFDTRVVIGMVVSLLGALALTLSVELVADFLSLPMWVVDWRFP
ncbi:MAG: DMT family transporter [Alphaproteobacteria bacterium]|nr:DMT family transporter [Alphaproteobacteria bacterium]